MDHISNYIYLCLCVYIYIYVYSFGNKIKEQRPSTLKLSVGEGGLRSGREYDESVSKCCTIFQNFHW